MTCWLRLLLAWSFMLACRIFFFGSDGCIIGGGNDRSHQYPNPANCFSCSKRKIWVRQSIRIAGSFLARFWILILIDDAEGLVVLETGEPSLNLFYFYLKIIFSLCGVLISFGCVCCSTSAILLQHNSSGSITKFSRLCLHGKFLILSCMAKFSCFSSPCVNGLIWIFRAGPDWY